MFGRLRVWRLFVRFSSTCGSLNCSSMLSTLSKESWSFAIEVIFITVTRVELILVAHAWLAIWRPVLGRKHLRALGVGSWAFPAVEWSVRTIIESRKEGSKCGRCEIWITWTRIHIGSGLICNCNFRGPYDFFHWRKKNESGWSGVEISSSTWMVSVSRKSAIFGKIRVTTVFTMPKVEEV